jgi:hypothetical protein
MLNFPIVHLPGSLINLLKLNVHTTSEIQSLLYEFLLEDEAMLNLIQDKFFDIDPQGRIDKILQSLGWESFRDRLVSIYYYHAKYGRFPKLSAPEILDPIKKWDTNMMPFAVSGYSRSFLLGTYFLFLDLKQKEEDPSIDILKECMLPEMIHYLRLAKVKNFKIDWLYLALLHFHYYLSQDRLIQELKSIDVSHDHLFSLLTQDQKNQYLKNMLNYSIAVQGPELFKSDEVE